VREKLKIFLYGKYILETFVHWLSKEIGSRSKFGFTRNSQKCNSHFPQNSYQAVTPSSNLLRKVNVVITTIASLLGARSLVVMHGLGYLRLAK